MKMVMQVPEKEISRLREQQQWKGHRREREREGSMGREGKEIYKKTEKGKEEGKRKRRRNRNEKKPISSSLGVQTVS